MQLYHDSRDAAYRSPGGALPCLTQVTLRLRVLEETPQDVQLRTWFGKEGFVPMRPTQGDASLYEATVLLPAEPCLFWYDFQIWSGGQFFWYGNAEDGLGGVGAPLFGQSRSYQITVYDPSMRPPDWTDGAVFYQIFPDRFSRGEGTPAALPEGRMLHENWSDTPALMTDPATGDNVAHDFFGGTLDGIRERLPYIASLGVTSLYLNPIFQAGTNHRYDTTDWTRIDPLLGTEEDFEALCADAAAMGIRVVLDGVFSHSGDQNPLFRHAREVENSPYRKWYQFEHWPDMYKSWWGFRTLPELDKGQPEVLRYFLTDEDAIVRRWLRDGAGGWRIDVADELPMPFLRLMRTATKETRPDAILIGEVWEDASNKIAYGQMRSYCLGDTLDGVMNYPLREAAIAFLTGAMDAQGFKRRMDSLYENYPPPFARGLMNVMGSHDRARTVNVLAGAEGIDLPRAEQASHVLTPAERALGERRLRLMLQLTVAMPGMPCVYYGDEAGMEGSADPFNRGAFPWGRENAQLQAFFRQALRRRREQPLLTHGSLSIEAPHPDVLGIRREGPQGVAHTWINRAGEPRRIQWGGKGCGIEPFGWLIEDR